LRKYGAATAIPTRKGAFHNIPPATRNRRHAGAESLAEYSEVLRASRGRSENDCESYNAKIYVFKFGPVAVKPSKRLASRIVTDQELQNPVSPIEFCRTLLLFADQMDCGEAHVHKTRAAWKEPGISQGDIIINELCRLQVSQQTEREMAPQWRRGTLKLRFVEISGASGVLYANGLQSCICNSPFRSFHLS
jgi:hypothetical protein